MTSLFEKIDDLSQQIASCEVPAVPRLIADDISPERLAGVLAEQGRIAIMSAEGDIFDIAAGRYSNGEPNFGVLLKGHTGEPLRIDRINRQAEFVSNPALTLGLAIQPDILRGLTQKPGFRGRGLLGRFLYAVPKTNIGHRRIKPPEHVTARYKREVTALSALPIPPETVPALLLDAEAGRIFEEFQARLEPRLAEGAELGHISDWAGKLAGAVARIAGLLHMAANKGTDARISGATMAAAIQIGEYFTAHAMAAFDVMAADPCREGARIISDWLKGRQQVTRGELQQAMKNYMKSKELDNALTLLEEYGYIQVQQVKTSENQKKPTNIVVVNPKLSKK
jgi:hypothetical protein